MRPITVAFQSNLSETPTSSILLQLPLFKHIADMFCYSTSAFAKQFSHLVLCKPNGFFIEPHIYFDVAFGSLVNEDLAVVHFK